MKCLNLRIFKALWKIRLPLLTAVIRSVNNPNKKKSYLVASKIVDFVVHGIEEYTSVIIVSQKSDLIKKAIIEKMGRGVTVLKLF